MDSQIKKRRLHEVTHFPYIGMSPRGQKEFGHPIVRKAYIAKKLTMVRDRTGEEVVSETQLYFDGYLNMSALDVMQFGFEQREYPVINFAPFDGLKPGTGTTVVYV